MEKPDRGMATPKTKGFANSRETFDLEADLKSLTESALEHGADRAKLIGADQVVADERVTLKCKIPPCEWYGRCLMCPPYSPSAADFRESLKNYHFGILLQVDAPVQEALRSIVDSEDQRYHRIFKMNSFVEAKKETILSPWMRLHGTVMNLEREALKRGYYLSLGLVAGHCRLCPDCDTTAPCKRPYEARPSMEACGIDVVGTTKNAGWLLPFPASMDVIFLNGLLMVV